MYLVIFLALLFVLRRVGDKESTFCCLVTVVHRFVLPISNFLYIFYIFFYYFICFIYVINIFSLACGCFFACTLPTLLPKGTSW